MAVTAVTVESILTRINNHFKDNQNNIYLEAVKIGWIDAAQKNLAWVLPVEFLQELIKTVSQATIASDTGSKLYELPADFCRMVEPLYKGIACKPIGLKQRQLISKNMDYSPTEIEPMAIIRGNNLEVFPSSGVAMSNGLEILYISQPITLISGGNIQLNAFTELIFNYSLAQGYAMDNQPEADRYLTLYINRIAELIGVR